MRDEITRWIVALLSDHADKSQQAEGTASCSEPDINGAELASMTLLVQEQFMTVTKGLPRHISEHQQQLF